MIERAFARTLRNFSTLFFLVAVIAFPIHVAYSFAFRDVIAASDYHGSIESAPVGNVGPQDLDTARIAFWIVTAVELVLFALAVRAARRVFVVDESGSIPTAVDGWRDALSPGSSRPNEHATGAAVLAGVGVALAIGVLVWGITGTLAELTSEDSRWVATGLAHALTRSAAAPFALGGLALFRAKDEAPSAPKF